MVMQVARQHVEDGPTGQGHQDDELHHRKAAAAFLGGRLGIALLVFARVGQLGGRAIHHFNGPALQLAARARAPVGGLGGGGQGLFQAFLGEPLPGLDIG